MMSKFLPQHAVDQLIQFRRLLISLLNTTDDILGYPRTIIPHKAQRHTANRTEQA